MSRCLAVLLLLAGAAVAQPGEPATDLRLLASKAARASKILMVRFEPSGRADVEQLDQTIAGDAALAAAFAKTFQVESRVLLDRPSTELHQNLGSPFRGTWPGVALVDRAGELLTIVDPSSWQSEGKWDVARLRAFVEFWAKPAPKSERLKECRQKYGEIYEPAADAKAAIAAAVAKAKTEGKHVLVKIGGNWCPWCYFLHDELETRPKLAELVARSYVLVRVNYDPQHKNEAVLAELEHPERFGFPVLVVLDGEGKRLHTQDSGLLEVGDHHDPRQVEQFLKGWTPESLRPRK